MIITEEIFYGAFQSKINRLGLSSLYNEVKEILISTNIEILEEKKENSAGEIRKRIDFSFKAKDWKKIQSGGINWFKEMKITNMVKTRIGIELQISARSDSFIRDLVYLRNSLQNDEIDVGIIIVPDDLTSAFLTDRTPSLKDVKNYIEVDFKEAINFPLVILAIQHDRFGSKIPKIKKHYEKMRGMNENNNFLQ